MHVLERAIISEKDKLLQKMLAGDRGRTQFAQKKLAMFGTPLIPALALGLSCQSELSSPDNRGKANIEPASKTTLESCGPACTQQSQIPAAAV